MELPDFSGRTTCLDHKGADWATKAPKGSGKECLRKVTFFDVQWSNCPVEVEEEVRRLWEDHELSNDHCFINYNIELTDRYPIIAAYLKARGITEGDEVLVHWWW